MVISSIVKMDASLSAMVTVAERLLPSVTLELATELMVNVTSSFPSAITSFNTVTGITTSEEPAGMVTKVPIAV